MPRLLFSKYAHSIEYSLKRQSFLCSEEWGGCYNLGMEEACLRGAAIDGGTKFDGLICLGRLNVQFDK